MTLVVRIYSSQKKASDAAKKVKAEGYGDEAVLLMTPSTDPEADVSADIDAAVKAERLPKDYTEIAIDSLRQGRSVLSVNAYFGKTLPVTNIMDSFEPVKIQEPAKSKKKDRLISEGMGIPLLWDGESFLARFFGGLLASPNFYFFGEPKLKKDPTPLSSGIGWDTLNDNATPLSSQLGLTVLSEKPHSLGEPQLSSDATPLSSKVGLKVLSDKPYSSGEPKLKSEPAPFSKALGLSVLIDD